MDAEVGIGFVLDQAPDGRDQRARREKPFEVRPCAGAVLERSPWDDAADSLFGGGQASDLLRLDQRIRWSGLGLDVDEGVNGCAVGRRIERRQVVATIEYLVSLQPRYLEAIGIPEVKVRVEDRRRHCGPYGRCPSADKPGTATSRTPESTERR